MSTWFDNLPGGTLDVLLEDIRDRSVTIRLLDTYTTADSFATVDTNTLASAGIGPGDFSSLSDSGVADRRISFSGASDTASSDSSVGALHIAICSASVVLAVTDETSDQAITNGNPITFPAFYIQSSQPTQA